MASTSTELIETMISLMPDAALVVDGTGTIAHTNDALAALFGYAPGELLGQRIEVLVPERFRSAHRSDRTDYIANPRTRSMGAGLALFGRRRDGSEFPIDISLAPLALGGAPAVVAAIRDVSDRREAEGLRAQLAAIVESSGDAIFAMAVNGTVQSWNPGAQRTLGCTPEEMIGVHVATFVPDDSSLEFEEQLGAAMRGELRGPRDTEWLTKDGRRLPVAVVVSPLRSGGDDLTGFSVMVRDITERKRAEAELRRLLAEGERNARWQAVMADFRLRLLDGGALSDVLELLCERLCELLGAKGAAAVIGRPPRLGAAAGSAVALRDHVDPTTLPHAVGDVAEIHRADQQDPAVANALGGVDVLVVPFGPAADSSGYLLVAVGTELDDAAMIMVLSLAEQAALAVELDRAKADRELLLIGDERERIARDLHDFVIQRLFASGLNLQSALPLVHDERAAGRLSSVVDELDGTIREIRTTIFTLAPPARASSGLRLAVLELVNESSRSLGFEPSARFEGPVDSAVGAVDAAHVLAVVREALSNVARHAFAERVLVEICATGDQVSVVVADDGIGVEAGVRESGLRNLRARAEDLGGSFALELREGGGTQLEWRMPTRG